MIYGAQQLTEFAKFSSIYEDVFAFGRKTGVTLYKIQKEEVAQLLVINIPFFECIAFSQSGDYLFGGDKDGTVFKIDLVHGVELTRKKVLKDQITSLLPLADDISCVVGGNSQPLVIEKIE